MKKFAIGCLFLVAFSSSAQYGQTVLDKMDVHGSAGTLFRNKVLDRVKEGVSGTPYLNDMFTPSDIAGAGARLSTRYNAYKDEIEVQYEDDTFVMPKDDRYGTVRSITFNYTMELVKYTTSSNEDVYGYLINLMPNEKVSLYRRERTIMRPAREADNSYSQRIPASYDKLSSEYFLKMEGDKIVSFPKNKKALIGLYPTKSDAISSFLKSSKTSFKKEGDLMEITKFLGTL